MSQSRAPEDLLRELVPQVLGTLLRIYGTGQFEACEDAVQDAVVQALGQWSSEPVRNPRAWLTTVARRRLLDGIRSETARRARETEAMALAVPDGSVAETDDSLDVLLLCCHPALSSNAQIALTLRAVAGVTTAQIARALLIPEPTAAQRISRAKAAIRSAGGTFPEIAPSNSRIDSVLSVLYLTYTAGHTAINGQNLYDIDVTAEAIRLARLVHTALPRHSEASGLLALLLLTDARRNARLDDRGALVSLADQDRSLWNRCQIDEGTYLLTQTLDRPGRMAGPYVLQAAIAALHDEAADAEHTDWQEIVVLYKLLERCRPNPVTTLNRAVAESMIYGPEAGLRVIEKIKNHPALVGSHHLHAARAHLLDQAGERILARRDYLIAARLTLNVIEQRHLRKLAHNVAG